MQGLSFIRFEYLLQYVFNLHKQEVYMTFGKKLFTFPGINFKSCMITIKCEHIMWLIPLKDIMAQIDKLGKNVSEKIAWDNFRVNIS